MEQNWKLKTTDAATIYGVRNFRTPESDMAIFIVHGLTGHMHEYAIKRAADYFEQYFDVYRFNLYDGQDGGRKLIDCTIQTHANDLNEILNNFAHKYKKIFLIGHSYGGTTIMLANPTQITTVSLWDPSYNLNRIQKEFSKNYTEKENCFHVNWGTSFLIGKNMYEEADHLNADECAKLAKNFKSPVQVIHAGNGFYINDKESYHSFGSDKNIRDIVSGTTHCFYEGHSCDDLLSSTGAWFKRFI